MPTKRRRRERFRRPDVCPEYWALLTDAPMPENPNPFAEIDFPNHARELWEKYRDAILADWIEAKPGTRPSHWWLYDAPRMFDLGKHAGCYYAKELCEPRKLLKGMGQPAWEVLAITPRMHLGIPRDWVDGVTANLAFESQHDYLQRFGLLKSNEGSSLEPEVSISLRATLSFPKPKEPNPFAEL